jgi:hypothetical protein
MPEHPKRLAAPRSLGLSLVGLIGDPCMTEFLALCVFALGGLVLSALVLGPDPAGFLDLVAPPV